jgi:general stress protein 26
MKKFFLASVTSLLILSFTTLCTAEDKKDNSFLYVKSGDKPPMHVIYDENLKCVECHPLKTKDIDGYTSATMTLEKSFLGVMPREEIEKRVVEVLQGKHGREIFVLSTSYNNKPLATIIEFAIDPETLTLYGMSERQGEKLFHIYENNQVSLAYVRPAENYFRETLGVQIVGKAQLLTGEDPEYAEGLEIYLPSLFHMIPNPPKDPAALKAFKEKIGKTKIMTKVTPERIVLRDISLKAKELRNFQIWEQETSK